MLDAVIAQAVRARGLVLAGLVALAALGVAGYRTMPVDAFPDISPVMVPVFAEAHGMAPEEVERLIAFPIESAMNGLPAVERIKSTSAFGMAVIYVYFTDDTDIYFARQLVAERLAAASAELPDMHEPPALGPISTGLGQVFNYYLTLEPGTDTGGAPPGTYLRELNDWVVKYQLQSVRGVTDVLSIGGHVLLYEIRIDPYALGRYDLALDDVVAAVHAGNRNVGGQFLVLGAEEHLLRGVGLVRGPRDLEGIALKVEAGAPVTLGDVAEVVRGTETRRGVVTRGGEGEVVSGIVLKLYGENTSEVIDALYAKVAEVQAALPEGVRLVPYYEQAELVERATWTVKAALLQGAALVVITLALFLGNLRAAGIVTLCLPLCALVAFACMGALGVSANLMSLGGIAIAIGMLADGAIVMVENVHRHLGGRGADRDRDAAVLAGAREVGRPIAVSIAIILAVFAPVFLLEGVEAKMFTPMALSISFALLGSLLVALVAAPALAHALLKGGGLDDVALMRLLKRLYRPLLIGAVRHRLKVLALAGGVFALSLVGLTQVGTEFIPTLEEGSIVIGVTMAPSTALEVAVDQVMAIERVLARFPEVRETVSRTGRPEAGSHPHPVNYAEVQIELHPPAAWPGPRRTRAELVEAIRAGLEGVGSAQLSFTQPIQNLFDELLSGVKAELAIEVFGEDLTTLRTKADEIAAAIDDVPGLVDLAVEQSHGQPQVQVIPDREACRRFGVGVGQVLELVEVALGGEVIDRLYSGTRRHGIQVRYQARFRSSPEAVRDAWLRAPGGARVRLGDVAEVTEVVGPVQINRERNQRRWAVQANVEGRDLGSVFADVERRIRERVELPPGVFVSYGGQFENQRRATRRLAIIVPLVITGVFVMLWFAFGSARDAAIVMVGVPLGLAGGVGGLLVMGEYLSVPAAIGFIALFGIAMQNGVVLMTHIRQLAGGGREPLEALVEAGVVRLRPVLMTAATTVLGLTPLLLATGAGSEVQRPLATVVVFGLASATALTLFVLPAAWAVLGSAAGAGRARRR